MSADKISIIVPIYNVEAYLAECIKSILAQTYTNFELILVDDGSPDQCGKICDEYESTDDRVCVIHKTNGGLSDARNAGLQIATGEYITFIDSDDMVSEHYLELLYRTAQKYNSEIVQGEFTNNPDDLGGCKDYREIVYSRQEALEYFLQQKMLEVTACAKLYKKSCFLNVEYPVGRINEDNLTTYKNIWNAKKVVCIPEYIYFYRLNSTSIMNGGFSARRFEILSFRDEIVDFLGEQAPIFEKSIDYAQMRLAVRLINDCILAKKDVEYSTQMSYAREIVKGYCPDKTICESKYCLLVWLIKKNYWLYRHLVKFLR